MYRAQLHGTSAASVESLVNYIQDWARGGTLICAYGNSYVEPSCNIRIASLEECLL